MRAIPEHPDELQRDSRWPGFFPCPICIATTSINGLNLVEKVVGASIINRFPYVVALSLCRERLSARHYVRRTFMDAVERSGSVAVQFMMPTPSLQSLMTAVATIPEDQPQLRFTRAGLPTRRTSTGTPPVFEASYLIYECRLARPGLDFEGHSIYPEPWIDVGSHRVYFLEIQTILLREDIADGRAPVHWRSLPSWRGGPAAAPSNTTILRRRSEFLARTAFVKSYQPDYVFPSKGTIAFAADEYRSGYAIKHLPPLPEDQVEVDNDQARWPCFFPSSAGLITVQDGQGSVGGMTCGSTTILARHPLTFGICVSYARINERYAQRASLDLLNVAERFGCGVPIYRSDVLEAISYLGNVSGRQDSAKLSSCGLTPVRYGSAIAFDELPLHYDCRIVDRRRLGTHVLILGQVDAILVRSDLSPDNPLEWCPWAGSTAP
jgi:flavin reductase (DIM6/NTAB) family NADH-FMN oxidoreductase RutF